MAEEKLRLFIGTYVDLEPINAVFDYPIRHVEKQNQHITWKFYGETEEKHLPKICENIEKALQQVKTPSILFNRYELWADARFPRLLVLAGDDLTGEATKLYNAFNKNKFRPHITVARFKIKEKPKTLVKLPENLISIHKHVNISEISLIKSTLSPKGSIYEVIKSFKS